MSALSILSEHPDAREERLQERWEVHGVSQDPRRAAPKVRGTLDVRPRLLDSRLALSIESLVVDARLSSIDELGEWHFEGVATTGRRRTPVTVRARYHGMYRHGERATAWLSLRAESEPAGDPPRRRRLLRRRPPRPARLFEVEVNAELARP